MSTILKSLKWMVWDFAGARAIWEKIRPPGDINSGKRPPATFLLWLVGIYLGLFGVASTKYENRVDLIENRANSIFAQLSSSDLKIVRGALSRIPLVQNMPCPYDPDILRPYSIIRSLFMEDGRHTAMVELLKQTLEDWKNYLNELDLYEVDLRGAQLDGANLRDSVLIGADLRGARLNKADLRNAVLLAVRLDGAELLEANLEGISSSPDNLTRDTTGRTRVAGGYIIRHSELKYRERMYEEAWLQDLTRAQSFYGARMAVDLREKLNRKNPKLFESPFPGSPKSIRMIQQ